MRAEPTLVWLPRAADTPELVAAQQADLAGRPSVLTLRTDVLVEGRSGVGPAAAAVAEQLDQVRTGTAAVFGAGLGALVALRLAADRPDLVTWVAVTAGPSEPTTVLSVWDAVSRLLPSSAQPTIGRRRADVLGALDGVRAVEYRRFAGRVRCPALVICGADDRPSLATGRALVRRLPRGELRLVPGAGPGWLTEHPRWIGEFVRRLLDEGV